MTQAETPPAGRADADAIAAQFDRFVRAVASKRGAAPAPGLFRYITGEPHPLGNVVIVDGAVSPETLAEHAAPLCARAFPAAAVLLGGDRPGQTEALRRLGFSHAESMPLMSVTPDTLAPTEPPEGHAFAEIDPDDGPSVRGWVEALCLGYGLTPAIGELFGPARCAERLGPGAARHFAVTHAGSFVATSMLLVEGGLAGVYGVSTLPEHRGKGLGAHATAEPLRIAWARGERVGVLQASEMGAPVYRRIGFTDHASMELLVRAPD